MQFTMQFALLGFHFGGDAEAVEALVCKTSLSGFESHRYKKTRDKKARATCARYAANSIE